MVGNSHLREKSDVPKLAVIGAGPAGLFAAHIALKCGYRVALFESHAKPGGCASFFRRQLPEGEALFDAGATVLSGLEEGGLLRGWLGAFGVEVGPFTKMREMHYSLNGRRFSLDCEDDRAWIRSLAAAFPADADRILEHFPRLAAHAQKLQGALNRVPHMPVTSWQDLRLNRSLFAPLMSEAPLFLAGHFYSFGDQRRAWSLSAELRQWIDMNLLITLQVSADEAHPLWAAMALFFYPLGTGSLAGGMRGLFDPMLQKLAAHADARVFMRHAVNKISFNDRADAFKVDAAQGSFGPFDAVISTLPRYNTRLLFDGPLFSRDASWARLRAHVWGAVTAYLVVEDADEFPAEVFHLHSSNAAAPSDAPNGGEVYLSFSKREAMGRAPAGCRSVTLSTHARTEGWPDSSGYRREADYLAHKETQGRRLTQHFRAAFPNVKIIFEEFGTPSTFHRYTRRLGGGVGGLPLSRAFTGFRSPSMRTSNPKFLQIGDTSFPGQSVLGCALGAAAALEKLTDRKWRG